MKTFKTTLLQCEKQNSMGLSYPKAAINAAIKKIPENKIYLTLNSSGTVVDMTAVAGVIENIHITKSNNVIGTVTLLDTPYGRLLEELTEDIKIDLCMGGVVNNGIVTDCTIYKANVRKFFA